MIRKYRSPIPGHVRVVFELPSCVWADRISITGEFNDWRENDILFQQVRSGVWQAVLDLPLGASYEFRYIVDGRWSTDSHADGVSDNMYGSQNSLVIAQLPEDGQIQETPGLIRESRASSVLVPPVPATSGLPQHTLSHSSLHPMNHAAA